MSFCGAQEDPSLRKRTDMAVSILSEQVERTIMLIRGQRVMLDTDLATLYGVPAKTLNQAVRRNVSRFPADFMFQLTEREATALRSQFVTLKVLPLRVSTGIQSRSEIVPRSA